MERFSFSSNPETASGGFLMTNIWFSFILKLFFTLEIDPDSETIPITSVSSVAFFLNQLKVLPIQMLSSLTKTSNK